MKFGSWFSDPEKMFNPGAIISTQLTGKNPSQSSNSFVSMVADPMDLFGNRAKGARDEVNGILQNSADASLKELEDAYNKMKGLYAPLVQAGQTGLNALQNGTFTPTQADLSQIQGGGQMLGRKLRAMGRLNSTFGARQLGDYFTKSAQEAADRQYAPTLDLIKTGSNAINAVSQGASNYGQGAGNTLSMLGAGLNNNSQLFGQSRQNSMNGASNTLSGLAQYMNAQGGNGGMYQQPGTSTAAYQWNPDYTNQTPGYGTVLR